jgi:hypothetical protein
MTKKLDKMLAKKKTRRRKVKEKKLTKKQRLAIRGVTLSVGYKKAMELMAEHIKEQGRKVPAVYLGNKDPASSFAIAMYHEIGQWSEVHCSLYITAVTGAAPTFREPGAMQGTIKAIFHAFFDEGATKEEVNHYSSPWKMWPNVRSKPEKKERSSKMATKKASQKKASKKKAPAKRANRKKAPAKKKKKKTTTKKSSGGRLSPITGETKLLKKKTSCGESEAWDEVLACLPKKAITFDALCKAVEKKLEGDEAYTRRVVGSLRRRGCIVTVD